jgi:hypothetical protein
MAKASTPRSRKAKKPKRRPSDEVVRYVVDISDWDWGFSFGIGNPKYSPDPYEDFRHLQIRGTLVRPRAINADTVELTFIPHSKLNEGRKQSFEVSGWIGFLQLYHKRLTGIISMPSDVLSPILQMLIASRFQYVDLSGPKLRHGKANLRSYRFEMSIDEDDMPDG